VAVNGFFVAAEFALVGARRTQLEPLAAGGNAEAALARDMLGDLDRYIAAAQLGITLASLALGWVGESAIAGLVEPPIEYGLEALLGSLSVSEEIALVVSHGIGVAVSFFVITTLHIVLGEQAPKVMAIRAPEQVALWIARPLAVFNTVFAVFIRFLDWATSLVLRLIGVREPAGGHTKVHSAEELRMLVEESGEAGALDQEEQAMLLNVFTFADRPAYQAMIPRTEMLTIDHDATLHEFVELFAASGHTRYPVLGPAGIDDVQGVVSAKELLLLVRGGALDDASPITPLIKPAFFTPESKRVGDLLQEMRASNTRLAVLIDEYGGVAGIVTLEDLIEQIIGDLSDDYAPDTQELTTIDEHTSVVEGQVRIEDVNDELDLALPSGEYETLAGFILEQLGRLPQPGDAVHYKNARLTVLEMQGPRIRRVEVTKG
ncbi:MAG: HlyC/CorC family transporter, partial [Chloroflexales bacterium]|nr:HlyC/CorC family transporter [Chloroflexales bacterium]